MLKKFKLKSIKKFTAKNLEKRDISNRNNQMKHLGFLVHESYFDNFELLYNLGVDLGVQRKDVKVFTFVETKRKIPTLRIDQITNKEFSWRGEIQCQTANDFLEFPFDVLIGFYKNENEYLDALVSKSNAKFKIGFVGTDERLYDLLLDIDPKNIEVFKEELMKYLKILNKI